MQSVRYLNRYSRYELCIKCIGILVFLECYFVLVFLWVLLCIKQDSSLHGKDIDIIGLLLGTINHRFKVVAPSDREYICLTVLSVLSYWSSACSLTFDDQRWHMKYRHTIMKCHIFNIIYQSSFYFFIPFIFWQPLLKQVLLLLIRVPSGP